MSNLLIVLLVLILLGAFGGVSLGAINLSQTNIIIILLVVILLGGGGYWYRGR